MKKKALIITYYWPPAGGPGVQRWLKLSNYLLENNIKPVIYTPSNPKYPSIDESLLEEVNPEIEVIKHPIFEPFGNWFTRIRKKGIPKNKDQSIFDKLLIYLRGNFFIPDSRIFWISPSVNFLSKYIPPFLCSTKLLMVFNTVLFPEPLGPKSATISELFTFNDTSPIT